MDPLGLWGFILSAAKNSSVRNFIKNFFNKKKKESDPSDPPLHITTKANQQAFYLDQRKSTNKKTIFNFITINIQRCSHNGIEKAKQGIRELVQEKGYKLLEKSADDTIAEIKRNEEKPANQALLSTLREIVPATDIPIIRASLFLRKKLEEKKKPLPDLKDQILLKYGQRGARVSNLISAGYYEELIIPIYNKMKIDAGFTRKDFENIYETIIVESAYAVFVNAACATKALRKLIYKKIVSNKRYARNSVNIHGLGKNNVDKIEAVIGNLVDRHPSLIIDEKKVVGQTIYIRIRINEDLNVEDIMKDIEEI